MNTITPKNSNELAEARTSLATSRTLMASDRSLMAWVRTGLSMISFGFTIYKILEGLRDSGAELASRASPRAVGLFLIGLGTISIVMGTWEYWGRLKALREYGPIATWRPSFSMAFFLSVTGLTVFILVISRTL